MVVSRTKPLCDVPKMIRGSQPSDGGHLLFNQNEYDEVIAAEPKSSKWLRRIYGADEFINSKHRWCLWIGNNDLEEALDIPHIQKRLNLVSDPVEKHERSDTRPGYFTSFILAKQPACFGSLHPYSELYL